jgi:hypothetical protein
MLYAPLEQFQILSLISIKYLTLTSLLQTFLINILALVSLSFIYYNSSKENYLKKLLHFSPNSWQKIESISEITAQLISDIIATDNEKYFPIIFFI